MKTYKVVKVESEHPSFKWNDGLFIVVRNIPDNLVELCKLDDQGAPIKHKGKFEITVTGRGFKNIIKTNLTYTE